MTNGKISQFLKDHWRGIILVIGSGMLCAAFLYCCENGAQFSITKNKVIITTTKTK